MPQRRKKSLIHGDAPDTRIYHHEHRSKKGRQNVHKIRDAYRKRAMKEEARLEQMKYEADGVLRKYNGDKKFRKKLRFL